MHHLVRHFGAGGVVVRAVDNISFEVVRGDAFGLVGESGSTKSTVCRTVPGLERPNSSSVRFRERDANAPGRSRLRRLRREMQVVLDARHALRLRRLRREVQVVLDAQYASLHRRQTVRRLASAPLDAQGIGSRGERRQRVRELVGMVGLAGGVLFRRPNQFSGGRYQRVVMARARALQPEFIVLGEAASALEASIRQILKPLRFLQHSAACDFPNEAVALTGGNSIVVAPPEPQSA